MTGRVVCMQPAVMDHCDFAITLSVDSVVAVVSYKKLPENQKSSWCSLSASSVIPPDVTPCYSQQRVPRADNVTPFPYVLASSSHPEHFSLRPRAHVSSESVTAPVSTRHATRSWLLAVFVQQQGQATQTSRHRSRDVVQGRAEAAAVIRIERAAGADGAAWR